MYSERLRREARPFPLSPTPLPDGGGVMDRFGMAAMGWSLRTPADGSPHRSGIKAASRFDTRHLPPPNPHIRLLSVAAIAHCASISVRKCEHLRFSTLLLTAFARAHTALYATSGIGSTSCADTRCFPLRKPHAQQVLVQRLWQVGTHSCASIVWCFISLPTSPMLLLRSEVVGGVSRPEVLHFARRTLCFSPPIEHTPTSPYHEIKP